MGVLVVAVALVGHQNVRRISQDTETNFIHRSELSYSINGIRSDLFESYKAMDAFLFDATRKEYITQAFLWLDKALERSTALEQHVWFVVRGQTNVMQQVSHGLHSLRLDMDHLFQTRMDAAVQFPALGVGRSTLGPSQQHFSTALTLAMNEIKESGYNNRNSVAYRGFVETRYLWHQVISVFRLYLANRLGSYNEEGLKQQEHAIETLYSQLEQSIQHLNALDKKGRLGFQASEALKTMRDKMQQWHQGFQQVKTIHSGAWRADAELIQERIEPHLENISRLLQLVDIEIKDTAGKDFRTLSDVAGLQTQILFIIASFGLVFLFLSALSLRRLIFHPIDAITQALKAEAFGHDVTLPVPRSQETQDLIDAFTEMRNQIRLRQTQLEHQALHDDLTKLPNRALLHDRMTHAIHIARRTHQHLCLLMMDLDGFKEVNDTLGHHVGDKLLKEVGSRLSDTLREMDTVARLGGDEFAILLPNTDLEQSITIAKKILTELESSVTVDEVNLFINASIGIANYPDNGKDGDTLLQHADVAMYVAKRNKCGYSIYDTREDDYSVGRLSLMGDLRVAIDENELELNYQPKFSMDNGTVMGVEALLRWEHPSFGAIPPDQIVSLAEQTGLVNALTQWIIRAATAQCAAWRKSGFDLSVAVNLSVYNLRDPELVRHIQECLRAQELPPENLMLEITESSMMANPAQAIETLKKLDRMGVKLAIDDFGTGFSSLTYLNQLPVDELKIDQSFIMGLEKNESDQLIVRSTIELAHDLGLSVVAEGVETPEVYRALQVLGCDSAQGYFLSPPLKVSHLEKWLRSDSDIITQEIRKIQAALQNQ
ncbi:MAG: EAL domain-containing protein [Gammaproteobacteria bacterium]|nr:EAL domain-containing protein [Gammaproteobacteria bacterium]MDH5802609.1 EAL domain-containing protein [Gammaproteobacteria bacterium]